MFGKIFLTKDSKPNYFYLLLAFFIIITFPVFSLIFGNPAFVFHVCYSIVFLTSMTYSYSKNKNASIGFMIGAIAFSTYWVAFFIDNDITQSINLITNFIFFIFLLKQVIFETLEEKNITTNTLFAVSVGYLLLGMMGFWLLTFLDQLIPGSFTGNFSTYRGYDLIYFSFVTLTTLGYGDIQAINPEGKAICLIIGIVGQLYVSFTIAVIVGKYLNQKTD